MQSITINITKNFGKSITLELPSADKHVITHSHNPHLYADLHKIIVSISRDEHLKANGFIPEKVILPDGFAYNENKRQFEPKDTFRLPDDYDFGDERIDLENISD